MYRRFLKPGWFVGHFLVFLAVLVCLRLGLWQWHRTHEASGTIQNLGYTVLWPVFGAAFIYMWVRFLQLEVLKDAEDEAELTAMAAGLAPQEVAGAAQDPAFAPGPWSQADLPSADVASGSRVPADGVPNGAGIGSHPRQPGAPAGSVDRDTVPRADNDRLTTENPVVARGSRTTPSRSYTVSTSTVGDEEQDQDPELAAYNRALAALAEKDHRRAR